MKIVRIIARLNVGGPARHVAWVTAGLRRGGDESVLVAGTVPAGEDDMSYFAAAQGVEPFVIPEMSREISPRDVITVWKLFRLFRRERPDVVHTHTAKAGTVGRVAGLLYRWLTPRALFSRRRCRFVHTYHGHVFHSYYGAWQTRFFLFIERALARFATDRIVVISPQQFREIHGQFGVGRVEQFRIVPLGVDLGVFADWAARRNGARNELKADEHDILVGIVGRLTGIKDHDLFLRSVARYRQMRATGETASDQRAHFYIIGDGHLREALETQAHALGLTEEVTFTGTRDDPENFYPALDIVALTSRNEGTPLTLIEAMANARPVVATAVGGVVDLLGGIPDVDLRRQHDWQICERGVQVQSGDEAAFSHALAYLIDHPELREQMGARGLQFVERHYSKERLVADLKQIYEELLAPEQADDVARQLAPPTTSETQGRGEAHTS